MKFEQPKQLLGRQTFYAKPQKSSANQMLRSSYLQIKIHVSVEEEEKIDLNNPSKAIE